jgi:HPt (histidine-containing phosphotransfer) domain-containing protein/ABC-type transporter Mla MlaB component
MAQNRGNGDFHRAAGTYLGQFGPTTIAIAVFSSPVASCASGARSAFALRFGIRGLCLTMTINSDPALWEMFRSEVDTHMAVLCDGLLALEKDPQQSGQFDALMRAAHSIKGAAKIVGIPAAVQVAHALEDCFVAARQGQLSMSSSLVDVLFEGVDLLGRVALDDAPDAATALLPQVAAVTQKIERATRGDTIDAHPPQSNMAQTPPPAFRPAGAFDTAWVKAHHREIANVMVETPGELQFDLSQVKAIDPIGLALLATVTRPAARATTLPVAGVRLSGASAELVGLLRAMGLDRSCTIVAAGG